jgi:NTE family protein
VSVNAFILSGGGTLGSIQVGMLRALFEADIRPEVLVGTSIGAVNAAFLAADPCLERVEDLHEVWHGVRSRDLFSLNPLRMLHAFRRRGSLFPPEKWRAFLTKNLPYERIEDAAVPLRIIATDFEDGSPVVLDSGSVVDAVMASTSLPGIFPPQRIGDHLYLDGALSEPVPLKPAVDAGADTLYVLAVSHASPTPDAQSPGAILRHSLTILLIPRVRLDALQMPDGCSDLKIVQIPSVGAQVALWDMSCQDDLMERSYQQAAKFLADRARSAEGDGDDGTEVTTISEMSVEVDVRDAPAHESRPAEAR